MLTSYTLLFRLLFSVPRHALLFFAAASALALISALVMQYGFGLAPCHLCIVQRYPYAAVVGVGLVAAFIIKSKIFQRHAILLCALLFLIGGSIAVYHSGVEYGLIKGPASCTTDASLTLSVEDMRKQILNAPLVSCDQPLAKPLGVSLAAWNALLYGLLMVLGFKSYRSSKPKTH